MKKITILLIFLCVSIFTFGQRYVIYNGSVVLLNGQWFNDAEYSAEYQTVLDAMSVKPTGDTLLWQEEFLSSIDTCIGLVNAELLYVMATSSKADAGINWIQPGTYDLTEVGAGSLVHTPYQGVAADGLNHYTTGFNPSLNASVITQDNASIIIYTRVNGKQTGFFFGGTDGSNDFQISTRYSGDQMLGFINAGSSVSYPNVLDGTGFWGATRTVAPSHQLYHNGDAGVSENDVSSAIPNIELHVFQSNGDGGLCAVGQELSIVLVCVGVNEQKSASLNTIFTTYMNRF